MATGRMNRSSKRVSQNTAIMDLRVMSQVMTEAVRRNLAERNPAKDHGFKKSKPKKKPEMTDEEIRKTGWHCRTRTNGCETAF